VGACYPGAPFLTTDLLPELFGAPDKKKMRIWMGYLHAANGGTGRSCVFFGRLARAS
jgi:hypothetical protein